MVAEPSGKLLVGGSLYGSNYSVYRIDPGSGTETLIANEADGIDGPVHGLAVASDGTIYASTRGGVIHAITESPVQVTTVFSDPLDQITIAWDMVMHHDGTFYIADRDGYGYGEVVAVSGGTASGILNTAETRGLAVDPNHGGLLVSQWNDVGFCGTIGSLELGGRVFTPYTGFTGMNYSNSEWVDGDVVADVDGNIYTCSKDDWRVVRYDPAKDRYATIGSSYINTPTGLAIAPSTPSSGSTTGWSLYVAELDFLWEIPSTPPAAPDLAGCAGPASAVSRPGSSSNPEIFSSISAPIIGANWDAVIDIAAVGADASVAAFSLGGATSGVFLPIGELLALPPFAVPMSIGLGTHSIPLPDQCVLIGATFSVQGATYTLAGPIFQLTNAVDLTFGTY